MWKLIEDDENRAFTICVTGLIVATILVYFLVKCCENSRPSLFDALAHRFWLLHYLMHSQMFVNNFNQFISFLCSKLIKYLLQYGQVEFEFFMNHCIMQSL